MIPCSRQQGLSDQCQLVFPRRSCSNANTHHLRLRRVKPGALPLVRKAHAPTLVPSILTPCPSFHFGHQPLATPRVRRAPLFVCSLRPDLSSSRHPGGPLPQFCPCHRLSAGHAQNKTARPLPLVLFCPSQYLSRSVLITAVTPGPRTGPGTRQSLG